MENYNWHEIKAKIIEFSKTINIDKIGFTNATPFEMLEDVLRKRKENGYSSDFEEENIKLRITPGLSLDQAESIISIAVAYPVQNNFIAREHEKLRGKVCRASWGMDYHYILKEMLSNISQFLKELVPEVKTKIMVDTGPLLERAVAQRAGIGWIGKNSCLITPEYGSFVFLGEIITNLPLPQDQPFEDRCGNCRRCVTACPVEAILESMRSIDCRRCLAHQTQKKELTDNFIREKIGENRYIYGCDVCQLACPYNSKKINDWHREFNPIEDLANPILEEVINLTNKDFKSSFAVTSAGWRGKKILQRNAILIIGSSKKDLYLPFLQEIFENDTRLEIRIAALWAISRYINKQTKNIFYKYLISEEDTFVCEEIKKILKSFINEN